ncbi:MAG: hypothetical protein ACI814_002975, partial [Mariniblastus sp.]
MIRFAILLKRESLTENLIVVGLDRWVENDRPG